MGTTSFLLDGSRSPGMRTKEMNFGDFIADSILWVAQQSGEEIPVAASVNAGLVRSSLKAGDITVGNIVEALPYINYVFTIRVTGSQLLEAFEASCANTPEEMTGFPQVAGITYTIDTSVPYEKGDQYPDSIHYAPAKPGSRVLIQTVDGQPFDIASTYTIATMDFLCYGGDTYHVFAEAAQETMKGTGYVVSDAVRYYLAEACMGEVSQEYAEPQGRITIR